MGLVSNLLRGYRVLTQGGATVPSRNVLELPAGALVDDPANNRTIFNISANGLSPTTLTLGTGYTATGAASPVITTDGTVTNLGATIAIPPGKNVTIFARVTANLIGDGTNGGATGGTLILKALILRAGSSAPVTAPSSGDNGSIAISPFGIASPLNTPAAGKLALVISGSNAQLQVQGEAYGSLSAWVASTSYTRGGVVTGAGGAVYVAQSSGTSGATQPMGTGAAVSDDVVTWCYAENDSKVTISWTLNLLEILKG